MNKPEKTTVVGLMREALAQQFDVSEEEIDFAINEYLENKIAEALRSNAEVHRAVRRIANG